MNYDITFLRDEVRNGFYIPTAIKQCFAAQLSVLTTIDAICQKHNIQYFADWGTLLAAVRHGGYIPWDDDLDIGMKRTDYIKFMQVAKKELPDTYDIHTYETKEDHWLFITKILGTSRINFDPDYLNSNNNFPYIPCVDIFLIDNLYKDEEKEKERSSDILHILSVADGIVEGKINPSSINKLLSEIELSHNTTINRSLDTRHIGIELYKLIEKRMGEVPDNEAGNLGQIFPWILKGGKGYPKKYYDSFIRLPYENITIPVPAGYNEALSLHYGQYLNVVKGAAGHNYPFFEGQRNNLRKVAEFELPEYRFKDSYLKRKQVQNNNSLKSLSKLLINELENRHNTIDFSIEILSECQQFAIELGTIIEKVKGENTCTVKLLEEYCEIIYNITLNKDNYSELFNKKLDEIKLSIDKEIMSKDSVVFLTITPNWWNSFNSFYQKYNSSETDIYVVPLPTIKKDAYGRLMYNDSFNNNSLCNGANVNSTKEFDKTIIDYNLSGYPDNITLYDFEKIDLELLNPKTIFIQEASDFENPCYSIPVAFYSDKLQQYTNNLVYVMPMKIADFTSDDYCENYNLKHYLFKPGIMSADKIYVYSENTKERFIEGLCIFSNEKYKDYWNSKIYINSSVLENVTNNKKTIFYCIGENEITEAANMIDFIKERINILSNSSNKIDVVIGFYPADFSKWCFNKLELREQITATLTSNNNNFKIITDNNDALILNCDAYYGAPSPYVRKFIEMNKPVMIENLNIY